MRSEQRTWRVHACCSLRCMVARQLAAAHPTSAAAAALPAATALRHRVCDGSALYR